MNKILYLSFVIFLAGCNPLGNTTRLGTEFHPGADSGAGSGTPATPSTTMAFGDLDGFKVSPGAEKSVGTNIAMEAYITTTNEKLKSSNISGDFTINNSHPR
jgi:hypothetical protein